MTHTSTDLDELRLNNGRAAGDLALSGIVYRNDAGRIVDSDPQPAARPDPEPQPFEPAREFGPVRIPGALTTSEEGRPCEHNWATAWDDGTPWWVTQAQAEEREQDRQRIRDHHAPDYYAKPYSPPSDDENAGLIFRGSRPDLEAFVGRAREQGYA